MTLVTVEFLMPGQQLHTRHVALLQRHGTWRGGRHRVTLVSGQSEDEIISDVSTTVVTSITSTTTAADVTS